MWSSSGHRERLLAVGMMTYVSSAYLHSSFHGVAGIRPEASTTCDTGPVAELCTMLVEIWHNEVYYIDVQQNECGKTFKVPLTDHVTSCMRRNLFSVYRSAIRYQNGAIT